ncbi:MAG: flagellar motor switch protein FliM [Clostridium sp.]|nr:flagellar motor switch protein FliM [Clostridium sp.]MCM1547562.1 flagellar motor switch protein FliM [Ruminococcus sp.]
MSSKKNDRNPESYNFPKAEKPKKDRKIREYDFKKPKKFTKEHLRGLNTVNENIIRIFSSNISSMLRTFCEIEMNNMEECRYMEYLNTLPDKTFIGLLNAEISETMSDENIIMMHFPTTINFFLIDILLGGDGHGYDFKRGFTEIEIAILDNFYKKMANNFSEAWKSLVDVNCTLVSNETNPKLAQFVSLDDSVIVLSFQMKISNIVDTFSFCIPSMNLDSILRAAMFKHVKSNKQEDEKENMRREALSNSLNESAMELTAILDTVMLDVHDIVNLAVSDVIPLSKKIDDNIIITVEGEPKFSAKLGDRRIKKSVKICDIATSAEINEFNNL